MKETTPAAMPPCFDRWCKKFDDLLRTKAQKREFRHYLGGLLGESERKNVSQMARDSVEVTYHKLHHFLTEATWEADKINERRLEVMSKSNQTRISRGFSLIVDDSGHRKSGNFTAGVGRQYIGEIGKTDNGNVVVTTHLYDGKKSLPLDIELYQHGNSLPEGKKDPNFKKKPELALELIDKSLKRGYKPGIVLIDSGYGNNTSFLNELEKRKLNYLGGLAKNRKVKVVNSTTFTEEIRLDKLAESLPKEAFSETTINLEKPRTVWVAVILVEISRLEGQKKIAIVMNDSTFQDAEDIDYFITNVDPSIVTPQWIVDTYSQRNWVEVFYREVKGWLGLKEYQVRSKRSLKRHFILVFCAYTFILWHKLTGGLRRRWANKPLNTFPEALEAFRTAMSFRFIEWLNQNRHVFAAYKASCGFIWA
ncbi:MAG: IS701 family transposase [Xenococcaceae cyanobacterium MO_207.B15]|nr:IS701 family transposase [Xenococcaceae cyanobacterium MO_207.B15]